ncbi:MAG TPA: hypothetical protein VFO77_15650 [Actinoplanes sp.]|nr:hypothetical protein [Actinoplanes sp.]
MRLIDSKSAIVAAATAIASVLTVTSALIPASPAQAAEPTSRTFCATMVGPKSGPDGTLAILARHCSTTSADAADALPNVAAATKLMTWYEHAGWKGETEDIYGSDGTCDATGYRFRTSTYWGVRLSSIRGHGACNKVRLESFGGNFASSSLPYTFGATVYNDNVKYVEVWHG